VCPCVGLLIDNKKAKTFRSLFYKKEIIYCPFRYIDIYNVLQVAVFSTLLAIAAAAPEADADAAVISPYAGYAGYAGLGYAGYAGAYAGS
jgi:hypothetical protein